jgi:superfamily I DNA and/or RNA helicase
MQIEPIVVLPETLTETICRRFGADPTRFNAPSASAQTLADDASPYYAEFATTQGDRTVGVPLLVHRRCGQPMFSIANTIAYEGLMVYAKKLNESAIRDVLGDSQWFDVRGTADEKWCPEEGNIVVELLRKLACAGVSANLYIVTPFVVVQQNLRKAIQASGVLNDWIADPNDWLGERIGTVHVVQGREAEAVILVLGAPDVDQAGARGWAGGRPNLLNVAVTRAKEVLYVIGNRQLWRGAGVFKELDVQIRHYPASIAPVKSEC